MRIRNGRSGPLPNAHSQRSRLRTKKGVTYREGVLLVPECWYELNAEYKDKWVNMWTSELARCFIPELDVPPLSRLFGYYMEHDALMLELRKAPSPDLAKLLNKVWYCIGQLEDRFGLTPQARLPLALPAQPVE